MTHGEVVCPHCNNRLKVPTNSGGKQAVCAVCQTVFGISQLQPYADNADGQASRANPFSAPQIQANPIRHVASHRAGFVLAFSLLGWFFCPVFSVAAWLMGRSDLRQMDRGAMDESGRTVTQVGTIVAIVNCVVTALGLAAMLLFLMFGAVASVSM